MKQSRKCAATSGKNKHKNSRSTPRNTMSTSNMSTSKERIDIRIPKTSKIYEYLYVDTSPADSAAWKRLDRLLAVAAEKEEEFVIAVWEDFLRRISVLYPEKRERIDQLRPLILRKIILEEELSQEYWDELRKP